MNHLLPLLPLNAVFDSSRKVQTIKGWYLQNNLQTSYEHYFGKGALSKK
jgi:hypothetical protein